MSRERVDLSPQEKRALLEKLLRERAQQPCGGSFPLSFAQQRMLLLEKLAPGGSYQIAGAVRIQGPLREDALRDAVRALVRRHESLRTTFPLVDGEWVQSVAPSAPESFRTVDVHGEKSLSELLRVEARRSFDLASGPCFRATLFRRTPDDHVFLLCMHHVLSDGWSMGVLVTDLAAFYEAAVNGEPAVLSELPIQYRDFAVWQRQRLEGEHLERQLDYWLQRLEGVPSLELPLDRVRPAMERHDGAEVSRAFPAALVGRLGEIGAGERATPFMTLLAAFQALLYRYTGQTDVAVGTPISGRNRPEVEALVGLFMNTLVLRTDTSGRPTFRELVRRVRDVAVQAYEHQEVPFAKLVQALRPERDPSRNPLFQVMFALQSAETIRPRIAGLTFTPLELEREHAQLDLSLEMKRRSDDYLGTVIYNTSLFDAATVERMLEHFHTLLADAAANPDGSIAELRVMSEAEEQRVLREWNATEGEYPRDLCLPQLFEAQVERAPDAVAAVFDDRAMTYAELNAGANRVAHRLRALDVGRGDLVGIVVRRGFDMLAGMLGTLKAGAAYVPIDPGYPAGRVALMLADSGNKALCTQSHLLDRLPEITAPIVVLDDREALAAASDANPDTMVTPDHVAYVIYTSGSSGRPKGVQITGRSLVNFLWSMRRRPGLSADDVLVAVTSISFDISCLELYLPLVVGARLVIAAEESTEDGSRLAGLLEARDATVMQATPATWKLLQNAGWQGRSRLRVLCGGESLRPELAEYLLPRCAELWNLYGPTETTIWSTVERIEDAAAPITVGRPIANTTVFTLDAGGRPTPPGIPGEVCIGGDGVARGYLNRPELTAERFVEGPVEIAWAGTLYRTGDRGRFGADGRLEHLGRLDNQIKIRGYRVEPGEVESALLSHPAICEAVVVARDARLLAYVVYASGPTPTVSELRDHLGEYLPSHLVPAIFIELPELPLTPNGKVDRNALPDAFGRAATAAPQFVEPETESERLIACIWSELLDVEQVGALDNFFDIGGHSLLAMQVVTRIGDEADRQVDLRDIFFRNLRQLAAAID
jgi:amino acid adenylation domain-containing protein